jgi:hypothetical protein
MKTIIAGSRTIDTYTAVALAVARSTWAAHITEVVSGAAPGVDALGERWAKEHGVPAKRFRADWERDGKAAGPIRNAKMAEYADALIAVWDGESRGTADMVNQAQRRGLKVYVHRVRTGPASVDDLYDDAPRAAEPQPTDDTLLAAARLSEHRAWLAAAKAAPVPAYAPTPPYAPLRPAEHDAAVAEALARGTTTLQQFKERPMARVKLQTPAAPSGPSAGPARVTCVVCQMYAPRALEGHPVCAACTADPAAARSILTSRSARVLAGVLPAQGALDRAYAALDAAEQARWRAITAARRAVAADTADAATRERLRRTQAAMDAGDPRISEALRAVWVADEALYWANEVAADEGRRVAAAAAQFEEALAALGQGRMDLEAA